MPQKIQHQRAASDLADQIDNAFAGNVRSGAMDRFKKRWKIALGIEVGTGRNADGAFAHGVILKHRQQDIVGAMPMRQTAGQPLRKPGLTNNQRDTCGGEHGARDRDCSNRLGEQHPCNKSRHGRH